MVTSPTAHRPSGGINYTDYELLLFKTVYRCILRVFATVIVIPTNELRSENPRLAVNSSVHGTSIHGLNALEIETWEFGRQFG